MSAGQKGRNNLEMQGEAEHAIGFQSRAPNDTLITFFKCKKIRSRGHAGW